MDKLTTSQQNAFIKLSDLLKITAKLLEAGVDEQVVTQIDRNALMNAWAEIVATSKEKETGGTGGTPLTGYNAEIEKQRLEMEREFRIKEFAREGISRTGNVRKRRKDVRKKRNDKKENVGKRRNVRRESERKRRKDVW